MMFITVAHRSRYRLLKSTSSYTSRCSLSLNTRPLLRIKSAYICTCSLFTMQYVAATFSVARSRLNCVANVSSSGYLPVGVSTGVELNWCLWYKMHFYNNYVERPRVKLPPPWFYNKPWLKLGSANSLDMTNLLKVKLDLDQVSTKTRHEKFK